MTIIDYYLPGYKAGGPVRTTANTIDWLGDEFEFYILTSDRDFQAHEAYPDVPIRVWQKVGKANVMYLPPSDKNCWAWRQCLNRMNYDVVYLNGFFSRLSIKTMVLRWLKLIPNKPIILAPRGEFSKGALSLKHLKKLVYLTVVRWINLYQNIIWQASSEYEKQDILDVFNVVQQGGSRKIMVAPDLPEPSPKVLVAPNLLTIKDIDTQTGSLIKPRLKMSGSVKIIFLSRIVRKKNLDFALRVLSEVQGEVDFDIYGPLEDAAYWQECEALIRQLPANIRAIYRGVVKPERVMETFSQYHVFFFPTRGENFGHVILEAMRAGCPVLISDQTPWRYLTDKQVGWDLSLEGKGQFVAALHSLIAMDDQTFREWVQMAYEYGNKFAHDPAVIEANRQLFSAVK